MNISALSRVATRAAHTGLFTIKKFSPEILTTVGVAGVVVSTVMVARATLKLEPVVDKIQYDVAQVKDLRNSDHYDSDVEYNKDLGRAYLHGGINLVKLYGPAVTMSAASLASIVAAHGIMRRRNVALVAAYKAVESAFGEYRKRVVEELGEDKDYELYHGITTEQQVDAATGKKVDVKVLKDPSKISQYAVFFDEGNPNYEANAEYNKVFLRAQQNYLNDRLQAKGHVVLNEVYRALGFEDTSAGAVVGWVISEGGDNFIDFGLYNVDSERARAFVNGDERAILLDFNVDGVIYDKIDKRRS